MELINDEVDFYRIREAKPNPKAKLKSKKFITEKLIERIPEETLHEQISEELFERDYTIYD